MHKIRTRATTFHNSLIGDLASYLENKVWCFSRIRSIGFFIFGTLFIQGLMFILLRNLINIAVLISTSKRNRGIIMLKV